MTNPSLQTFLARARSSGPAFARLPLWVKSLILALLATGLAVAFSLTRTSVVETTAVVVVFPSQGISVLNASGYVVAQRKAAVSTKAQGRLEWLGVTEGSRVRKGEVIARLESQELAAQLLQAKANVGLAQAERDDAAAALERSRSLLAKSFISPASFDTAKARFDKAAAQLRASAAAAEVARAALAQTEIRAPFDGVVLTKNANVGDNITPFSSAVDSKGAVVTIADMTTLEVEADVSESSVAKLTIGQPVEIGLDALPNERFLGKVARMVPTIDRAKATRLVKLQFVEIDERVLPDMSAKVAFLQRPLTADERKPVLAVNRAAVREEGARREIYVLRQDRLETLELPETAPVLGDLAVVPGLKAGDRVVLRPASGLRDGQRVRTAG
ncbi:MAG: efflux RND transporter periplasmic adaptor subunit [Betaproteobacteria bacterium]|nr:efflux RND transporter periplasmic adaptor subunit [Betaproteobacteria bacterium]